MMKRRRFLSMAGGTAAALAAGTTARPIPRPASGGRDGSEGIESRRQELFALLGDIPPRHGPVSAETLSVEEAPGYTLERLRLDLNGVEPVPAVFVKPKTGFDAPLPAVLYNHSHGGKYFLGKRELLEGNTYMASPPYAEALTRMGYAALAIDHWLFGERSGREELDLAKEMLWKGTSVWGMMVYDSLRAIDYLSSRKDVDMTRSATLGMSMGSTMAWWLAALDTRVRACVDICCLTDFQALLEHHGLKGHGIYYYVPGLLKHFTTAEINRLIVPRPHLALAGLRDRLTPVDGLDRIDEELRTAYRNAGAPGAWRLLRYDGGHEETAAMRAEIDAFLEKFGKKAGS
jgi:hypothetical protein